MAPALRPCVFFDRDGVVNQSPGPGYVNHLADFHLLPGFADCVRAAAEKGFPAVVVTTLASLAALGAIGAAAGGAPKLPATVRVLFWGAAAMAITAGVGRIFGVSV